MYQLEPHKEKLLLWLLALTQFTIIMDFMVMMPLGPQIMHAFQIGPAGFATAVSAYSWCAGISGLFAATYIDRFDRRKLMLMVYALFTLSNLACAMAPTFEMLLASRAFAGLTGGVLGSLIMAILSDVIPTQRRGAATGIVMTAFSIAAIAGVPAGIALGAHFGWFAPFYLLVGLSATIWFAGHHLIPSLAEHLAKGVPPLKQVLPNLIGMFKNRKNQIAYFLTFIMMFSHMLVIPFIAPTLVVNHGIAPENIAWIYMAGGAATFFTSRLIGRWADNSGKHFVFRCVACLSMLPILFITHLPNISLLLMIAFFPLFMVTVAGRMVPMQALLTTVPNNRERGAFLSLNSAIQSLGTGCGAWVGGLFLSKNSLGQIEGYGYNGWLAIVIVAFAVFWIGRVHGQDAINASASRA